jgi:glycosyltransferase involved in cell wall biosynthesis
MRVLHVHSGNLYGGVETLMGTLARNRSLCPSMEPHFALCFDGRLKEELLATGVPVYSLGAARVSRPLTVLRARRALSDLLKRERFDVAICHSTWTQAIFGPVIRATDMRLVFWLHGRASGSHWTEKWARRSPPDSMICVSNDTALTAENLFPGNPKLVLYAPFEMSGFQSRDECGQTRAELRAPLDSVIIIQVSRMEPGKGHLDHLKALARLPDSLAWTCWIVGGVERAAEKKYFDELTKASITLGLENRVRFLGHRSDVKDLLSAADIFCQPNRGGEGFSIAFLEAFAAGLPIVTTALGGALEIVDETCGFLLQPGDTLALGRTLQMLIENSAMRTKLGTSGRRRVQNLCDPKTQLARLSALLMNSSDTQSGDPILANQLPS